MRYHQIKHDDMNNGDGLRVTLFVSGCSHYCKECHNPETWDPLSGIYFDDEALLEIINELGKEHISGLTLSGGDPLYEKNLDCINDLIDCIRKRFPDKTIWLYSGFKYEDIFFNNLGSIYDVLRKNIVSKVDVFIDGRFEKDKADVNYHWAGSTNQRVINIKETLKNGNIVLWN